MRKGLFTIIFILITLIDNAQNCFFAKQIGSSADDVSNSYLEEGKKIVTDAVGNSYVYGIYIGSADLNPGSGVFLVSGSAGRNSFIVKLDVSGNFVWGINFASLEYANDMEIDNSGNLVIVGACSNQVDFDPGAGTLFLSNSNFILKLNSSGNLVWLKSFQNSVFLNDIDIDMSDNIVSFGRFSGTNVDFDPNAGVFNMSGTLRTNQNGVNTYQDDFVLKLSSGGNFIWVKSFSGSINSWNGNSKKIAIDNSGNIFLCADFNETIDFDPGSSSFFLTTGVSGNQTGTSVYICKLNSGGNFLWAQNIDIITSQFFFIQTDPAGNLFFSGCYSSTTDLNGGAGTYYFPYTPSGSNNFILKINMQGLFQWAANYGGVGQYKITALKSDDGGNIYAGITYNYATSGGLPDFDPGPNVFNLTGFSTAIFKLNSAGSFAMAKPVTLSGMSNVDYVYNDINRINSIDIRNGFIHTTGRFGFFNSNNINFNPDPNSTFLLASHGYRDVFISKIPILTSVIQSITNITCPGGNNGAASINVLDGSPPYTFSWNNQPNNTTNASSTLTAGTYIVTVTDATGCSQSAPSVIITEPPAFIISTSHIDESCTGGSNNGEADCQVSGGTPPYTYLWNTTPNQMTSAISNLQAGNYEITITDANGCKDSATVVVNEEPNPASFSYTTNDLVASFSVNGTGCNSFVWDFGNGNTSTINPNPVVTYATAGTYGVCLQCNGHASCIQCINITVPANGSGGVNVEETINALGITVYPNPSTNLITIENKNENNNSPFVILNALGQKSLSGKLTSEITTVDITHLQPGFYLLQVGETKEQSFKLIKK